MSNRRPNVTALLATILLLVVLLPAGYMGSYYAMLTPKSQWFTFDGSSFPKYEPDYRVHNDWVHLLYWPAHRLDRTIRPEYWGDFEFE